MLKGNRYKCHAWKIENVTYSARLHFGRRVPSFIISPLLCYRTARSSPLRRDAALPVVVYFITQLIWRVNKAATGIQSYKPRALTGVPIKYRLIAVIKRIRKSLALPNTTIADALLCLERYVFLYVISRDDSSTCAYRCPIIEANRSRSTRESFGRNDSIVTARLTESNRQTEIPGRTIRREVIAPGVWKFQHSDNVMADVSPLFSFPALKQSWPTLSRTSHNVTSITFLYLAIVETAVVDTHDG